MGHIGRDGRLSAGSNRVRRGAYAQNDPGIRIQNASVAREHQGAIGRPRAAGPRCAWPIVTAPPVVLYVDRRIVAGSHAASVLNPHGVADDAIEVRMIRRNRSRTLCAAEENTGPSAGREIVALDVTVLRTPIGRGVTEARQSQPISGVVAKCISGNQDVLDTTLDAVGRMVTKGVIGDVTGVRAKDRHSQAPERARPELKALQVVIEEVAIDLRRAGRAFANVMIAINKETVAAGVINDVVICEPQPGKALRAVAEDGLAAARDVRSVHDVLVDRHIRATAI